MASASQPESSSSSTNPDEQGSRTGLPQKKLRSSHSRNHSFIRFWNVAQRRANIIWINFSGARVSYRVLAPGGFLDMNTFETHPWVFEDADTGDRMVAMGKEVFEPVAYNIRDGWPPQRQHVLIHVPVYSLQERCLQILRDKVSPEQLERPDIPLIFRREIQRALAAKRSRVSPHNQPA